MRIRREHIIGGALIALSLFIFPGVGDEIRFPKQLLMIALGCGFFAHYLWKRVSWEIGAFFGFLSISSIVSGLGYAFQMHDLVCVAVALGISSQVAGAKPFRIKFILACVMWAALLNGAYGYVQMMGQDRIFLYRIREQMYTPTGFLGQQTLLGPILASGFVISLFRREYYFSLFLLPVGYATYSSFTYAAYGIGFYLWLVHRFGLKNTLLVPILGILAILIATETNSELVNSQRRFNVWGRAIERTFVEHPLMGHGFGTYAYHAGKYQTDHERNMDGVFLQAHSDPIQLFHDTGLIGLALALVVLWAFIRQSVYYWRTPEIACASSVALVLFVNSFGNFPFRLVPQGLIFALSVILVISHRRADGQNWI